MIRPTGVLLGALMFCLLLTAHAEPVAVNVDQHDISKPPPGLKILEQRPPRAADKTLPLPESAKSIELLLDLQDKAAAGGNPGKSGPDAGATARVSSAIQSQSATPDNRSPGATRQALPPPTDRVGEALQDAVGFARRLKSDGHSRLRDGDWKTVDQRSPGTDGSGRGMISGGVGGGAGVAGPVAVDRVGTTPPVADIPVLGPVIVFLRGHRDEVAVLALAVLGLAWVGSVWNTRQQRTSASRQVRDRSSRPPALRHRRRRRT